MNSLWSYIENTGWNIRTKYHIVFLIFGIISALAGFAVWLIVQNLTLSTLDWMVCFIGYPVIISWFMAYFYMCNHEFHDEKTC